MAITTFEVTYPQRQDVIEKFDNRWTQPGNIITNGPFTLASWKQQNEIELRANNKYFRGKPNIDKVTMYMVNEKTTALTMYEQGNLDFMDESHSIPTLDKPRLAKLPEYKLVPQLRGEYYGFAVDRKPFDNPKLRRAFSLAIDREVFPKILQGGKTPATSWIPPGMLAHNPKIGLAYNPDQARRFLAEAGYSEGKGLPPIVLGTEPHASVVNVPTGTGPLPNITDDGGYWVDLVDLFMYGEQFLSYTTTDAGLSTVSLPSAAGSTKYASSADIDALFKSAASNKVRQDGIVDLRILSRIADTTR